MAAPAHGVAGIELAVEAGVATIEHCTWATSGASPGQPVTKIVDRIARTGQVVVVAGPLPGALVGGEPGHHVDKARKDSESERTRRVWSNAAVLREAGVQVALGTDSLFGQFPGWPDLALRAEAMVSLGGWDPLDVIPLMTKGGAAALGLSRSVGSLEPGFQADILVVDGDPSSTSRRSGGCSLCTRPGSWFAPCLPAHDRIASRQRSDCKAVRQHGQPVLNR